MIASSISLFAKRAVAAVLLVVIGMLPVVTSAATIFEDIQKLQQSIQLIEDAIVDSTDATYAEKQNMFSQLNTLKEALSDLQIAIGENSEIRTNIYSFKIYGDITDTDGPMTAKAVIEYDEEIINGETLPPATTTLNYEFNSRYSEYGVKTRSRELRSYVFRAVAEDTQLPYSFVRKYGLLTIKKFNDEDDVLDYFSGADNFYEVRTEDKYRDRADNLMDLFGRYSVIDKINVRAGNHSVGSEYTDGAFTFGSSDFINPTVIISLHSDQNEQLILTVGHPCKRQGSENEVGCTNTEYKHRLTYSVNGQTVMLAEDTYSSSPKQVFERIKSYLNRTGVGKVFGDSKPTSHQETALSTNINSMYDASTISDLDELIAHYLTEFVTSPSGRKIVWGSYSDGKAYVAPDECVDQRMKAATLSILEYFIVGKLQYAKPLYQITDWQVPQIIVDGEGRVPRYGGSECIGEDSNLFPDLPAVDWEAAIEEANPDRYEPWFYDKDAGR